MAVETNSNFKNKKRNCNLQIVATLAILGSVVEFVDWWARVLLDTSCVPVVVSHHLSANSGSHFLALLTHVL